jgi:hypothetical protein
MAEVGKAKVTAQRERQAFSSSPRKEEGRRQSVEKQKTGYTDEEWMVKLKLTEPLPALDRLGEFWHLSPGFIAGGGDQEPNWNTTRQFLTRQLIVWSTEQWHGKR